MIRAAIAGLVLAIATAAASQAAAQTAPPPALDAFVRAYAAPDETPARGEIEPRYAFALVDLDGDGRREAVVRLMSHDWCGSGGCTMIVLAPVGRRYRLVSRTTITWAPIRALATRSHGWRDLAVSAAGGGLKPARARLRFDGKGYPLNPTVPPAIPMRRAEGRLLIGEDDPGVAMPPRR